MVKVAPKPIPSSAPKRDLALGAGLAISFSKPVAITVTLISPDIDSSTVAPKITFASGSAASVIALETSSTSYILFYLLLNGSGVGRAYDDDMCLTNWDNMPIVRCVLDDKHKDFVWGEDESVNEARHKYNKVYWFEVPDSREGWAQAIEKLEVMAYEKKYRDDVLVLDFSKVRCKGEPIHGMQDRPASGPKPIMHAIMKLATVKNAGMPQWKQAMFVDHYLAECVLVGGARRSARIATKVWTDPEIFDFINIKEN